MDKLIEAISGINKNFCYIPNINEVIKDVEKFKTTYELLPHLYLKRLVNEILNKSIRVKDLFNDNFNEFRENIKTLDAELNSPEVTAKIEALENELKYFIESVGYSEWNFDVCIRYLSYCEMANNKYKVSAAKNISDEIEIVKYTQVFDSLYDAVAHYKEYDHSVFVRITVYELMPCTKRSCNSPCNMFLVKRDGELLIFSNLSILAGPGIISFELYSFHPITKAAEEEYLKKLEAAENKNEICADSNIPIELAEIPGVGKYFKVIRREKREKVDIRFSGITIYLKYLKSMASSEDIESISFGLDGINKFNIIQSLDEYLNTIKTKWKTIYNWYSSFVFDYLMPEDFAPVDAREYVGTDEGFEDWQLLKLTTRLMKIGGDKYCELINTQKLERNEMLQLVVNNKNILKDIVEYSKIGGGRLQILENGELKNLMENKFNWNNHTAIVNGELDSVFDTIKNNPNIYSMYGSAFDTHGGHNSSLSALNMSSYKLITDQKIHPNGVFIKVYEQWHGIGITLISTKLMDQRDNLTKKTFKFMEHSLELHSWQDFCRLFKCDKSLLPLVMQQSMSEKPSLDYFSNITPCENKLNMSIKYYTTMDEVQ